MFKIHMWWMSREMREMGKGTGLAGAQNCQDVIACGFGLGVEEWCRQEWVEEIVMILLS